jgi:hypothetical protein
VWRQSTGGPERGLPENTRARNKPRQCTMITSCPRLVPRSWRPRLCSPAPSPTLFGWRMNECATPVTTQTVVWS